MKVCTKCQIEKHLSEFHLRKRTGGYRSVCKSCSAIDARKWRESNRDRERATSRSWYEKNKEHKALKAREWNENNPELAKKRASEKYAKNKERIREKLNKWRIDNKERHIQSKQAWRDRNRDRVRATDRLIAARRRSNPLGRLNSNMGASLAMSLRGIKKGRKWTDVLGYSAEQLKAHLEKRFLPGMTWENYGQWHIDHIIPISVFNFNTSDDPDFKRCWALKNLRPLWKKDNLRKYNKLQKPFQPSLSFERAA